MAHWADVSVNKSYLVDLSWQNQNRLRQAYSWATSKLGLEASTEMICQETLSCFNQWHEQELHRIPGGYGGYVTPGLVKKFLKKWGKDAMAQQATQFIEQARALPLPQPATFTAEQLDCMSRTDLRRLARLWGVTQNNATNPELKARLKEHLKSTRS